MVASTSAKTTILYPTSSQQSFTKLSHNTQFTKHRILIVLHIYYSPLIFLTKQKRFNSPSIKIQRINRAHIGPYRTALNQLIPLLSVFYLFSTYNLAHSFPKAIDFCYTFYKYICLSVLNDVDKFIKIEYRLHVWMIDGVKCDISRMCPIFHLFF